MASRGETDGDKETTAAELQRLLTRLAYEENGLVDIAKTFYGPSDEAIMVCVNTTLIPNDVRDNFESDPTLRNALISAIGEVEDVIALWGDAIYVTNLKTLRPDKKGLFTKSAPRQLVGMSPFPGSGKPTGKARSLPEPRSTALAEEVEEWSGGSTSAGFHANSWDMRIEMSIPKRSLLSRSAGNKRGLYARLLGATEYISNHCQNSAVARMIYVGTPSVESRSTPVGPVEAFIGDSKALSDISDDEEGENRFSRDASERSKRREKQVKELAVRAIFNSRRPDGSAGEAGSGKHHVY